MAVVTISDSDRFNRAIEVLLTRGGTFETRAVGVLVVNDEQHKALEEAQLVQPAKAAKTRVNGKKKASRRPLRS
jgi:hypothetical protein